MERTKFKNSAMRRQTEISRFLHKTKKDPFLESSLNLENTNTR